MQIAVKHRLLDLVAVAPAFLDLLSLQDAMPHPLANRVRIHA